jgi:hypothetical protein
VLVILADIIHRNNSYFPCQPRWKIDNKGRSPSNGELSDFSFYIDSQNLLTGSLKNRSIDNLETQKKSISMKNSQFFDYLLYA